MMYFIDKRIQVICDELKRLIIKDKHSLENWVYKKGNYITPENAENSQPAWEAFDEKTMHWYGPDEHYWFRTELVVPDEFQDRELWLHVSTQINEWDDGKNPQFLLFVNGRATQGIDMNHREVKLFDSASAGERIRLDLQSYTGTLHSEFNLITDIYEEDSRIKELYYDIQVPLWAFARMEKDDKTRLEIETILNNTINLLDLRTPYSEEFYSSLEKAEEHIKKALYEDMAGYKDIIATCIGHTHIDVAWWWTVEQTREKVGRSFATVLKLMEEYPDYKFMSSQPVLYSFLKKRYPELYERVKERVFEGRWEPEGGMWLEADCNLTSGESLVRQFLYGKKFFKEEFGVDNRILWLPDVFGYSGALPQIMKKSGIDYFMTTKLSWNQIDKIPNDTLLWRGIDGSEILTHFITTTGVGQSTKDFFTTYNGMLHPDSIMGGWQRYQNKQINNDILVSFGYGDGGGGPTREMLEISKRMEKGVKGIPMVRQEKSLKYFDELKDRVINNKRLEVWEGEFYFEYHRGTLTSMGRNKRGNRKSELGLMDLELLSVLTKDKLSYPAEEIEDLWKMVLLNQFHDILPGTSIKGVYEVTKKEYQEIKEKLQELINKRLEVLVDKKDGITLVNTLGFNRSDIVKLPVCEGKALIDEEGNEYPIQCTEEGAVAYVKNLPSKGYRHYSISHSSIKENQQLIPKDDYTLETPYYIINLDENGFFTSIYDKEYDREILQENMKGNLMVMYEDKPIYYDAWDIDMYYTEKSWPVDNLSSMEWTDIGEVRATLKLERKISNSRIVQEIHFYKDTRRIDFETYVDWKEHQHLLKVHFPVAIHTDEATFDIQFGNLKRKTHRNTSWDMARFESGGQKWIDLSEGHYGVSILNDCKYGHSVENGNIGLSLIKSGIEPNPMADYEEHYFTYSLYPHGGDWREGKTLQESYKLNQEILTVEGEGDNKEYSLASIDKKNIIIETIKKAEDGRGVILRLYESENALTKANLTFNKSFKLAEECNLIEEVEKSLELKGNNLNLTFKPYEIKTIRVEL